MTNQVVIKVATRKSSVRATDGARVIVVPVPGLRGPEGPPGSGTSVANEVPAGEKDGINAVFTLAATPRVGSTAVYRNGLRERIAVGYSMSGATLTFSTPPLLSDEITVDYSIEG